MKTLSTALLAALAATAVQPALADKNAGAAVTMCKSEVAARYGEDARTKVHRIRSTRNTKVSLWVTGVSDKRFRVECHVDKGQQIAAFIDTRDDNVATR